MILHKFTIISGLGWLLDFVVFNILVASHLVPFSANCVSALLGVSFVFLLAQKNVFLNHQSSLKKAFIQYLVWNGLAIFLASGAIGWLAQALHHSAVFDVLTQTVPVAIPALASISLAEPFAKIIMTPITMYANFIAMGYILQKRISWR